MFSLYEGFHKISHPEELTSPGWAFGVLIVGDRHGALLVPHGDQGVQPGPRRPVLVPFIRHAKAPELPVVLLEDLAALVGLCLALFGVTMAVVTGDGVWDGVGTVAIGLLLAVIAAILAIETKSLLIGEGADPDTERRIVEALESVEAGRPPRPHPDAVHGAGRAADRREDRRPPRRHGRGRGPGHRRRRGEGPRRSSPRRR